MIRAFTQTGEQRFVLILILAVLTCGLTVGWSSLPANGQLPFPNQSPSVSLPPGVQRMGAIETAPVRLENRELFRVAALTITDRTNAEGRIPVEVRAETIEANLRQIIAFAPETRAELEGDTISYVTAFDLSLIHI
jgi:hypothetical protein